MGKGGREREGEREGGREGGREGERQRSKRVKKFFRALPHLPLRNAHVVANVSRREADWCGAPMNQWKTGGTSGGEEEPVEERRNQWKRGGTKR